MNHNIYLNRFTVPVVTGTPQVNPQTGKGKPEKSNNTSFQDVLKQQIGQEKEITFSKHAATRVEQRNIDLSATDMARLNEGVRLAEARGLNDTLILVDKTAFIVNVRNSKVITTVSQDDLKGNVFTNIDGTVII